MGQSWLTFHILCSQMCRLNRLPVVPLIHLCSCVSTNCRGYCFLGLFGLEDDNSNRTCHFVNNLAPLNTDLNVREMAL